ncbi:hypothetical protein LCGC14_1673420, partial [marine sediment metagenome]
MFASSDNISFNSATGQFSINISLAGTALASDWNFNNFTTAYANNGFSGANLSILLNSFFVNNSYGNSNFTTAVNSFFVNNSFNIENHSAIPHIGNTSTDIYSMFASSDNISFNSATGQFSINISLAGTALASDWNFNNFTTAYSTNGWNLPNFTSAYSTQGWNLANHTAIAHVGNTSAELDIWIDAAGDTTSFQKVFNWNESNLTRINRLEAPDGSYLAFGQLEDIMDLNKSIVLFSNQSLESGEIVFVVGSPDNTIHLMISKARNNSGRILGNSWMIIPENISNIMGDRSALNLTDCLNICDFFNETCRLDCDTAGYGASLLVQGGIHIWRQLFVDGDSRFGDAIDVFSQGRDVNMVNTSLHVRRPRIEEIGVAIGEVFDALENQGNFNDGTLNPFVQINPSLNINEWFVVDDAECFDDECAHAGGGTGSPTRIMETNVSTFQTDECNISFIYTVDMGGSDTFDLILNNNSGSGDVTLFTTSSAAVDSEQNFGLDSRFKNASIVTIGFEFAGNNQNLDDVWLDNIVLNCNSTISTLKNITRFDTEFFLGDGSKSQRIFWNDSTKILEIPGNTTFVNVEEQFLNVTETIDTVNLNVSGNIGFGLYLNWDTDSTNDFDAGGVWTTVNDTANWLTLYGTDGFKITNSTANWLTNYNTNGWNIVNDTANWLTNYNTDGWNILNDTTNWLTNYNTDGWNLINHTNVPHIGNTSVDIYSMFTSSDNISFNSGTGQFSINISVGSNVALGSDWNQGNFSTAIDSHTVNNSFNIANHSAIAHIGNTTDELVTGRGISVLGLNVTGTIGMTLNVSDVLYVNASSGRVGIGTSSPDSVFHIKADIPGLVGSHSAGQIIIQNPDDDNKSNVVITAYESDGDGNPDQQLWYLGSSSSSNSNIILLNRRNALLQFGTNDNTQMTILGNGNVGIGTTSPNFKLDVAGTINASELNISAGITLGGVRETSWPTASPAAGAWEIVNDTANWLTLYGTNGFSGANLSILLNSFFVNNSYGNSNFTTAVNSFFVNNSFNIENHSAI